MLGDLQRSINEGVRVAVVIVIMTILLSFIAGVLVCRIARAAPFDLTGSQLVTLERSDAGDLYALATIVLDWSVTETVALVLMHDQVATWNIDFDHDRYVTWDLSTAWRPTSAWSVSLGRRWRVGPPPDYGGPWTYVQVWRGL